MVLGLRSASRRFPAGFRGWRGREGCWTGRWEEGSEGVGKEELPLYERRGLVGGFEGIG
jgi:hypothetical protein